MTTHPSSHASTTLTFFLTPIERRRILRQLRRISTDRARALCTLVETHARTNPSPPSPNPPSPNHSDASTTNHS